VGKIYQCLSGFVSFISDICTEQNKALFGLVKCGKHLSLRINKLFPISAYKLRKLAHNHIHGNKNNLSFMEIRVKQR
jgi:hypothetical protein